MRWKLPLLLFMIFCYLQYSLWFGKNNFFDYQTNMIALQNLRFENNQLKARNEQMFAEINDLQRGFEAVEERARSHLGMIKANEYFYRIINDAKSQ